MNRTWGLFHLLFGGVVAGFCLLVLAVVALQKLTLPDSNEPLLRSIRQVHGILVIYMPLGVVGGIAAAVSGVWLRRGEERGRRLSHVLMPLFLIGLVAYAAHTLVVLGRIDLGGPVAAAFVCGKTLGIGFYPALSLVKLRRATSAATSPARSAPPPS
jgi:hypothetical protein